MGDSPRLLIATANAGKLRELSSLLRDVPFDLVSLRDLGISEDVEETGATYEANALIKATAYCRMSGLPSLADDSGLEVEALGWEPGVRSARYAGPGKSDSDRIAYLLRKLDNKREAGLARFRCAIAVAWPDGAVESHDGEVRGEITKMPRGENGFGYDPIFVVEGFDRTMAELTTEEKERVSHRARAAHKATASLKAAADQRRGAST